MDETRAQAIRARIEAATPGPWMIASDHRYPQRIVANEGGLVLIAETYTDPNWPPADAELIAAAPTDLADLLDERKKLLAVVEAAEQYHGYTPDVDAAVRAYRAATTGEASNGSD